MRPTFERFQMVTLATDVQTNFQLIPASTEVEVEGYWDEITGGSWMYADGNPAALVYAMRSATKGLPLDDDVVYIKHNNYGSLVHLSELQT